MIATSAPVCYDAFMRVLRPAVWWALLIVIALRPWALEFVAEAAIAQVEWAGVGLGLLWWLLRRGAAAAFPRLLLASCGLLMLAWLQAALFGSGSGAAARQGQGLLFGIAVGLGVSAGGAVERRQLLFLLTALGTVLAVHALWQAVVLFPSLSRFPWHDLAANPQTAQFAEQVIARRRVFGPFPLPGLLAGALGLLLPLSVMALGPWAVTPARRVAALTIYSLQGAALLLTQSLGGLLSVGAATCLVLLARRWPRQQWVPAAMVTVACVAGLFLLRPELGDPGHARNPIVQRWQYWQSAAAMIREHPWRGIGPGAFAARYASPTRFVHNAWLQAWTDWGLLGVIGLAGLCAGSLRAAARGPLGLQIGLAAFWLLASIDITWSVPQVAILWWAALGLTAPPART